MDYFYDVIPTTLKQTMPAGRQFKALLHKTVNIEQVFLQMWHVMIKWLVKSVVFYSFRIILTVNASAFGCADAGAHRLPPCSALSTNGWN